MEIRRARWLGLSLLGLAALTLWTHFHDIFDAFRARDWHITDLLNIAVVLSNSLMGLQALVQPAIRVEDGKVHFFRLGMLGQECFPLDCAQLETGGNGGRTLFFRLEGRLKEFYISETSPLYVRAQVQELFDRLSARPA